MNADPNAYQTKSTDEDENEDFLAFYKQNYDNDSFESESESDYQFELEENSSSKSVEVLTTRLQKETIVTSRNAVQKHNTEKRLNVKQVNVKKSLQIKNVVKKKRIQKPKIKKNPNKKVVEEEINMDDDRKGQDKIDTENSSEIKDFENDKEDDEKEDASSDNENCENSISNQENNNSESAEDLLENDDDDDDSSIDLESEEITISEEPTEDDVEECEQDGRGDYIRKTQKTYRYDTNTKPIFRGKSSTRLNLSFTNDRIREIERNNRILLDRILSKKPTYINATPKSSKISLVSKKPSSAAINRKKLQTRIDSDNQILKKKLEAIAFRRTRSNPP